MIKFRYFFFIFLIAGCTKNIDKHVAKQHINTDKVKSINATDLFELHTKTILKLPDSILFGVVDEVLVNGNKIYLLDKNQSRSIVCFDATGNFIFQLKGAGKGPYEFTNPELFQLDSLNNNLIVYDRTLAKILIYSLNKMKIVDEITQTTYLNYIGLTKSGNILYVTDDYTNFDKEFNYINVIPDLNNFSNSLYSFGTDVPVIIEGSDSRVFFEQGKDIYYLQPFTNVLYKFDDLKYSPIIDIDFSNEVKEEQYRGNPQDAEAILYRGDFSFYPHRGNLKDSTLSFFFYNSINEIQLLVLNLAETSNYRIYSSVKNDWFDKPLDIPLFAKNGVYYNVFSMDELSMKGIDLLFNLKGQNTTNFNEYVLLGYSIKF